MTTGKHYCYRDALDYLLFHKDWILVHAVVTGQGDIEGIEYGHAWVEKDGMVYDPCVDVSLPANAYRSMGHAKHVREYSYEQSRINVAKFKHYGPWDKTISSALHLGDDDE